MITPTEQELIEQARELGCTLEVGGVIGLGVAVVEALRIVKNAGYPDPIRIEVDLAGLVFLQVTSPRTAEAAYIPEQRLVVLNGQSDTYVRLGPGVRSRDVKQGVWGPGTVSAHPLAPLIHMVGHAIHHYRAPETYESLMTLGKHEQPWWVEEIREIPENFVSEAAMVHWMGFVGEVFTAIVLGIEVSPVVIKHYKRVEGPMPISEGTSE